MNKVLIKRVLLLVAACVSLSLITTLVRSFQSTDSSVFIFGAMENFFRWWNELDPSTRFLLILGAAIGFGLLTGFAATGAGGLLFGVFTGFSNFCSFSSMLTSAFTKTTYGQKLRKKYGTRYDHYIMWLNWASNVVAFSAGGISAINASKAVDALLPFAIMGLSAPDMISQSNALLNARKGNFSSIQKYISDHANDDRNGLAMIISSALLITPAAALKVFQVSDEAQLEHLVEETGFKLNDPDVYERIKSFYEVIDKTKENLKSEDKDEKSIFNSLFTAYNNIDFSKETYDNDLYQSESTFVTRVSLTTIERLGESKSTSGNWDDINSLWQDKYKLFQHVMQSMDNNSSYTNQGIFYDNIPVYMNNKIRGTYAFLELLNGIPKKSFNISGYEILYNEYNHNLLVLKDNNILDIINIDPQFLTFLRFSENHSLIRQENLESNIDSISGTDIKTVPKTELLNMIFETALLREVKANKDIDKIEEKLIEIIRNNKSEDIIKQALSDTNLAFEDYLKSFSYNDYKSKDFASRQLRSKSNTLGLRRMDYYLFLEKSFSRIYADLFNVTDYSTDELLKSYNNNLERCKEIMYFKRSLDCRTMIVIPYHFR